MAEISFTGKDDPIVVVGMAIRLPGGVRNTSDFWNLMINKNSGLVPIPPSRWNIGGFYSPVSKGGTMQNSDCYIMEHIDLGSFDQSFFSCGPQEIERMDPMQRQLLEITKECLDSAGETQSRDKEVGCYVGTFSGDWESDNSLDSHVSSLYRGSGYMDFFLPNRVSYEFGWTGPSLLVKTGCSASMIALHQATQAVHNGECIAAIALGCNLIMSPLTSVVYTEAGILSKSGVCKSFDMRADGYGRGEAVNAVYVKKMSSAIRDGNPIRAIIRASATNHDGRSNGIMNPNTYLQEALIRKTYSQAGISDYCETAFFECHGTGTPTGDPLEVGAVARVFGERGILIGAVKPNVGHSEGAAGLTSIIKAVLALENKIIPPNIHFNAPNPRIPWKSAKLVVPVEPTPWPSDRKERISVNSFGVGGSNAHVILESCDMWSIPTSAHSFDSAISLHPTLPRLLLFSASHLKSLDSQVEQHRSYLESEHPNLDDVAHTLGFHRDHLAYRTYAIADGQGLFQLGAPKRRSNMTPRIVFVFTGQGAQWPEMGKFLLQTSDVFQSSIRRMDDFLQSLPLSPSWTLENEISKTPQDSRVGNTGFSHPCTTAVQIALVDVLHGLNIYPQAVIGHSSGEIAAAYAAGSLTAEAAMAVSYYRAWVLLNGECTTSGAMAAVGLGVKDINRFLIPGVVVGCENSPVSTTLTGDRMALKECVEQIRRSHPETLIKMLRVGTAFHSSHMEPLANRYEELIQPHLKNLKSVSIPMFSSVIGARLDRDLDTEYWRLNFVQAVLFNGAMTSLLLDDQNNLFIEVGPHPALRSPVSQIVRATPCISFEYIATLDRGENASISHIRLVGELSQQLVDVDISKAIPHGKTISNLPTYAWLHDTKYIEQPRNAVRFKQRKFPPHDLLGSRVLEGNDIEPAWRNVLDLKEVLWLSDHVVNGQLVFPATGYMAMAGEAIWQIFGDDSYTLRDVSITTALILAEGTKTELFTRLIPDERLNGKWYHFKIMSSDGEHWVAHCTGLASSGTEHDQESHSITAQTDGQFPRHVSADSWYRMAKAVGLEWGTSFQGLDNISVGTREKLAAATVYDFDDMTRYTAHPTLLDQLLQIYLVAKTNGLSRNLTKLLMPVSIGQFMVSPGNDAQMRVFCSIRDKGANYIAVTAQGRPRITLKGLGYVEVPAAKGNEYLVASYFDWRRDATINPPLKQTNSDDFHEMVSLLGFKFPTSRVLEFGNGSTMATRMAISALHPTAHERCYSQYFYAAKGGDLHTAEDSFSSLEYEVTLVDISDISSLGTMDIILMSIQTLASFKSLGEGIESSLRKILRVGGRLVCYDFSLVTATVGLDTSSQARQQLQHLGFSIVEPSSILMAEPEHSGSVERVNVLANGSQGNAVAKSMQVYLQKNNVEVAFSSTKLIPTNRPLVISVLDLDSPVLFNLDNTLFQPFMSGLAGFDHAVSIVWVIPSAQMACSDPRPAMMLGVARTIRLENSVDITTVEVDSFSLSQPDFPEILWKICQSLPKRVRNGKLNPDYEYAVHDGIVKIQRLKWFRFTDIIHGNIIAMEKIDLMFRDDVCYLIIGGMGGLGRSVATWMVENGARSLTLLSPSAAADKNKPFIAEIESSGCVVNAVSGDVGNYEDVLRAIQGAPRPVGGVMQLSMALRDNLAAQMTFDEWQDALRPRIHGAWNIHNALRNTNTSVDFFILFSSAAGIAGNVGQANYAATNTYLDAFAKYRHHHGLPASVLDLGAVGDVGWVKENEEVYETFRNAGLVFLTQQDVLNAVAIAVANSEGQPLGQLCLGIASTKSFSDPSNRLTWKRDVRFGMSHHFSRPSDGGVDFSEQIDSAQTFIQLAKTDPSRLKDPATIANLSHLMIKALADLLAAPIEDFIATESLGSIGLDSLVSIELVDWIRRQFGISLTSMDVTQSTSLIHLAEKIINKLQN